MVSPVTPPITATTHLPANMQCCYQGIARRFAEAMTAYAAGALLHIDDVSAHRLPTLDEMIATRRLSSGVTPLYALVEFGHELKIPDYVFDDPAIKELQVIGTDFVAM